MASKVPPNGSVPTVHIAGVAPSVPKGKNDPCRHRRNKKKKTVFVVYKAEEDTGSGATGKFYIGRTRGVTADAAKNTRERGHHRTDIGQLEVVCVHDTYSACRGAEQKHYDHMVAQKKQITSPKQKGKGACRIGKRIGSVKHDHAVIAFPFSLDGFRDLHPLGRADVRTVAVKNNFYVALR